MMMMMVTVRGIFYSFRKVFVLAMAWEQKPKEQNFQGREWTVFMFFFLFFVNPSRSRFIDLSTE